jgi:hypothetical protein
VPVIVVNVPDVPLAKVNTPVSTFTLAKSPVVPVIVPPVNTSKLPPLPEIIKPVIFASVNKPLAPEM